MLIDLKPSRFFFWTMTLLLGGAILSIFCSQIPSFLQVPLALGLLAYGACIFQQDILLNGKRSVVRLVACDDNTWLVEERTQTYPAMLIPGCTRMGLFCVLRFKNLQNKKRACVIFKDAVDDDTYRRLIVLLKRVKVPKGCIDDNSN